VRASIRRSRRRHVGDEPNPPAAIPRATAEIRLLPVEPEALVEAAELLESTTPREQARADDEELLRGARRSYTMEPERLGPGSARGGEGPRRPLFASVGVHEAGAGERDLRIVEGRDEPVEVRPRDRRVGVQEQDQLA